MKTFKELHAEYRPMLAFNSTLLDVPEDIPALLELETVQIALPLLFDAFRIRIEMHVIVGSEVVVWTGPKNLLPGRHAYVCLRRDHLLPLLMTGAMSKWNWSEKQIPLDLIPAALEFIKKIPVLKSSPRLAISEASEEQTVETELDLV